MKLNSRFGTSLQSTFCIMIRISFTYPPICFLFTWIFRKNGKPTGGYVVEILVTIRNVLRNVDPNLGLIGKLITLEVD